MTDEHRTSRSSTSSQLVIKQEENERQIASSMPPLASKEEPNRERGEVPEYVSGMRLYAILFNITLVMFLIMVDQTIVVTAIPRITDTFNSIKDVSWYGSGYLISLAAMQPLYGKIYQYYASKQTFLVALAIFELGSLISALAKSSAMLIIGRAVSGLGGSGLITGLLSILAASAPLEQRPKYLGFMMGVASLGLVLGPVLGGLLTQHASWRWCFWLNLPIGGITGTALSIIHIPDSKITSTTRATFKEQLKRLDLPGFILFSPATIMLLLALNWGGVEYIWRSPTIIGLFCGFAGACIVFLIWEFRQGKSAMIPLDMLKNKVMISASLVCLFSQGSLFLVTYYLPIWFQAVKNVSPTMGGVYYLPSVGSQVVGSMLSGALTSRLGYPTPFAILGCALATIASGLLSTLQPSSSTGIWVGYQLVSGFSRGMTAQQPLTAIQAIIHKDQIPIGNSWLMFCQLLGSSVGLSLGGTIFSSQLSVALRHFAPEVNAAAVFAAGATSFRTVVTPAQVPSVVQAYSRAITTVFYLGIGASSMGFVMSWGMGWTSLKPKKANEEIASEPVGDAKV
ncbi:hypothetical protein BP6252_06728 [Coleophoma cylindrospora]|uniref:Major facilitator superfamily (MFS) profile domain-containing protein n=1 Tax=Coleophoma cylindrospora TaxID=1849047 RepID=A0A3D8RG30_9HELO|nr:hypothetical protein BP6252_06728 [Coleophoma cylindrospora]